MLLVVEEVASSRQCRLMLEASRWLLRLGNFRASSADASAAGASS
jgi:hypothetical protein